MAIWPFNRNKQQSSDLPEEVQDYYQAEKRQKRGVAGLLAVATLVITVLLALGLYFGGRWLYRAIFDDDDATQETTSQNESTDQAVQPEAGESPDEVAEAPQPQPEPTPAPTPERSTPSADESNASSDRPDANGDGLPDTGPGDVVALFIGTVIIASLAHHIATKPRLES